MIITSLPGLRLSNSVYDVPGSPICLNGCRSQPSFPSCEIREYILNCSWPVKGRLALLSPFTQPYPGHLCISRFRTTGGGSADNPTLLALDTSALLPYYRRTLGDTTIDRQAPSSLRSNLNRSPTVSSIALEADATWLSTGITLRSTFT